MRISIIGTGGVGGYFGGRLAQAGHEVVFIARGTHLEAIQKNGLKVKSTKGDFIINPVSATSSFDAIENSNLILVCTKAWQVKETASVISPIIDENCTIMPLQNGIMAVEELSEFIPSKNIIGGLCRIFSQIESPGIIAHQGIEPTIIFGELNNSISERSVVLTQLFHEAGITCVNSNRIQVDLWQKFLMISSSALLAVTRSYYGELRSIPETRKMLEELYTEIFNVAIAFGIDLPSNIVEKTMAAVDTFPAESTSSLTRDVWEGKPSEIEYQNGTVVKLGAKLGVPTPINRYVYYSILPMEMKARTKTL
jgi:2-dehydropantoate 2-reductase